MKIIADPQTRQYELTYLVPSNFSETERKSVDDSVVALVKKHKGEVVSSEDWGKKQLAYTIDQHGKKFTQAYYTHTVVSFDPKNTQAFEKGLYLEERVIRHLVVVAEATPAKAKSVPAAKSAPTPEVKPSAKIEAKPEAKTKSAKKTEPVVKSDSTSAEKEN
jgi:small subunit ribosomal protein S6